MQTKRYGIYYAPATSSKLWQLGCQWLGRDCANKGVVKQPQLFGADDLTLFEHTTSARRYGFHATLKPPFRLKAGQSIQGLKGKLAQFAEQSSPVEIGQMQIAAIGRFLALVPVSQTDELAGFAAKCVEEFESFRAPMSAERRAKRMQAGLSKRQVELLDRWGYPYVMDQFRMHITLSDQLPQEVGPAVLKTARKWFGDVLEKPVLLDQICLFEEAEPGKPFMRIANFQLNGAAK